MIKNVRFVKLKNVSNDTQYLRDHVSKKTYAFNPGEISKFNDGYFLYSLHGSVYPPMHFEIVDIAYNNPQIQDHPIYIEKIESRFEILDL